MLKHIITKIHMIVHNIVNTTSNAIHMINMKVSMLILHLIVLSPEFINQQFSNVIITVLILTNNVMITT